MSKETLEELKAIIDNAPKCGTATHIDQRGSYIKDCFVGCQFYHSRIGWVEFDRAVRMRSLSDIKRIVELMEATKGMLQSFAGVQDGYWRNELNAARKALGLKV